MTQATATAVPGPRGPRGRVPASKFRAPKLVPGLVRRPRLLDRLDLGGQVRLALVVGPAGTGKTMLLADWLAARPERPSAWLSCDAADADPARFVAAIIEAARFGFDLPSIGEDTRHLMSLDGEVSADAVAALADDLDTPDKERVLVIDDIHLAGPASADALRWLVEYRPPSLRLVVASRADPPLRVPRMRAHQDLVELRDGDLAFSKEETRRFLAAFGLRLDEPELALVYERSEGWVAGLQMAAISIQGSPDPATAAARVQLHRHTVADYFLEEVLSRQSPEVVDFMLATSVLDELSGPRVHRAVRSGSGEDARVPLRHAHVRDDRGRGNPRLPLSPHDQRGSPDRVARAGPGPGEAAARGRRALPRRGRPGRRGGAAPAGRRRAGRGVQPAQRRGRAGRADQPDPRQRA